MEKDKWLLSFLAQPGHGESPDTMPCARGKCVNVIAVDPEQDIKVPIYEMHEVSFIVNTRDSRCNACCPAVRPVFLM